MKKHEQSGGKKDERKSQFDRKNAVKNVGEPSDFASAKKQKRSK